MAIAGAGCDKLPGFAKTESTEAEQADPTVPPGEAQTPPAEVPSPSTNDATKTDPEPDQEAAAPKSEFDGLLERVSGLADPKAATDPLAGQDNKTAWTHYKAKEWDSAAQFFARAAARDPGWKPAHNLACALAMAGKPDEVRVALAESIRRGGADARASAGKDKDLASVRGLPWFTTLLADKPLDDSNPEADEGEEGEEGDEGDDGEDSLRPANCPPEVQSWETHYCMFDALGDFQFAAVAFTTEVPLDLEIPERPKNRRWVKAKGDIPWAELRTALGIQHTTEAVEPGKTPRILEESLDHEDNPFYDGQDTKPFFWWPEDNTPVLVLPNKQKLGHLRFHAVTLARKTDAGWRAVNLPMTLPSQSGVGGAGYLGSGAYLRFDQLELFTFTAIFTDGDRRDPGNIPLFCRIRWEQGELQRACVQTWTEAQDFD